MRAHSLWGWSYKIERCFLRPKTLHIKKNAQTASCDLTQMPAARQRDLRCGPTAENNHAATG